MANAWVMQHAAIIGQWPEPDTLAAAEVDEVLARLRLERAAKLQRLRQLELQAAGNDDPIAFLDLTEARVELNALLEYWRRLLAQALAGQDWGPLGSEPPRFAERSGGLGWRSEEHTSELQSLMRTSYAVFC